MSLHDFLVAKFTSWVPPSPVVVSKSKCDVTLDMLPEQPFGILKEHLLYKVVRKTKIPPWSIAYSGGKSVKTIDNLAPCNPHRFRVKIILKASSVPKFAEIYLNEYGDEDAVYEVFNKYEQDQFVNGEESKEENILNNEEIISKLSREKLAVNEKDDSHINKVNSQHTEEVNEKEHTNTISKILHWDVSEYASRPKDRPWLESAWSEETWCNTDSDGTSAVCFCMTVQGGYIKQIQMLLDERPALLEIINPNSGYTPLTTAVRKGDLATVKFLLSCGADPEARSLRGRTALHEAALAAHNAVLVLLLDRGANITARDVNGLRVEHCAVDAGSLDVVRAVLDRGGDVAVTDRHGWTPLFRAVLQGASTEMIVELVERGSDVTVVDVRGLSLPAAAALLKNKYGRPRSAVRRAVDPRYPQLAARAHFSRLTRKIHTIHTLTHH